MALKRVVQYSRIMLKLSLEGNYCMDAQGSLTRNGGKHVHSCFTVTCLL